MARPKIVLDEWKEQVVDWAKQGHKREEIQRRLQEQGNIKVGSSTLSAQMRAWGIRYTHSPTKKSNALRERVKELFHTRPDLRDAETVRILHEEGFHISGKRALARLRIEDGLYKRVDKDQEEKIVEQVKQALRHEFGDNCDLPEELATRDVSVYLRSKYNLVGRDRIRRIAAELNPEWARRRVQKGQFPRAAPSTKQSEQTPLDTSPPSPVDDIPAVDQEVMFEDTNPTSTSAPDHFQIGPRQQPPNSASSSRNSTDSAWLDPLLLVPYQVPYEDGSD